MQNRLNIYIYAFSTAYKSLGVFAPVMYLFRNVYNVQWHGYQLETRDYILFQYKCLLYTTLHTYIHSSGAPFCFRWLPVLHCADLNTSGFVV